MSSLALSDIDMKTKHMQIRMSFISQQTQVLDLKSIGYAGEKLRAFSDGIVFGGLVFISPDEITQRELELVRRPQVVFS